MDKNEISLRIIGKNGDEPLSPANQSKFDEDYLQGLIRKATPKWRGVNADEWLTKVRGGFA